MIPVAHLTRRYAELVAVDDVLFHIDHGEVNSRCFRSVEFDRTAGLLFWTLPQATL